jgi:AcrR family transcriptional regulator
MSSPANAPVRQFATPVTAAQSRILDAALDLIATHGVAGTSYQMIADAVGITKAGVYRQYKAKDDLIIALIEKQLGQLEDALIVAELSEGLPRARSMLLSTVVDVAVAERKRASTLQFDPAVARLLAEHPPFQRFNERLYCVLVGNSSEEGQLVAAMLSGAVAVAVTHPLSTQMDDDTLRALLLKQARAFINLDVN